MEIARVCKKAENCKTAPLIPVWTLSAFATVKYATMRLLCCAAWKYSFFAYSDLHFLTTAFFRDTYILTDGITTRARNRTSPVYISRFRSKLNRYTRYNLAFAVIPFPSSLPPSLPPSLSLPPFLPPPFLDLSFSRNILYNLF